MEPRKPLSNVLMPPRDYEPEFRSHCVLGEDPEPLELLAHDYFAELNPQGTVENFLVQTLVLAEWNQRRWDRIETALLRGTGDPVLAFVDPKAGKLMTTLAARLAAEQRRYFRASSELRRLQHLRRLFQG